MLAWNNDFATGLETIDKQHRMLIDHINRLEEIIHCPVSLISVGARREETIVRKRIF